MVSKIRWWRIACFLVVVALLAAGCDASSPQDQEVTPTPTTALMEEPTETPTPTLAAGGGASPTPAVAPSPCQGLAGALEVQVLVGPAEAAGLEPVAVGEIPIAVVSEAPPYVVEGGGAISYEAVLEKEWGTYAVTMDMDVAVNGECEAPENEGTLQLRIEMSGEQMVEVDAEGFQGEYPWAGEHELQVAFPLEDGATAEGEGWTFVLHLNR